jgi:hypothetical protein
MKNFTAARVAIGEEPIAAGGWCFETVPGSAFRVSHFEIFRSKPETRNSKPEI